MSPYIKDGTTLGCVLPVRRELEAEAVQHIRGQVEPIGPPHCRAVPKRRPVDARDDRDVASDQHPKSVVRF